MRARVRPLSSLRLHNARMPHGFASWVGVVDAAQCCIDDASDFVKRHVR